MAGFLVTLLNPLKKIKNAFALLGISIALVLIIGLGTYLLSFTLPRLIGIFLLVSASILMYNIGKITKDNKDIAKMAFIVLIIVGLVLTIFPQVIDTIQNVSLSIVPIK